MLIAVFSLASRCNGSRWTNPETGIPRHPGGAPEVGYLAPEPIVEPEIDGGADADTEIDALAPTDAEGAESSTSDSSPPNVNPY